MRAFFEFAKELELLKELTTPTAKDLEKVLGIIKDDVELTRYFYRRDERGALSLGWLKLLDGAGEFERLGSKDAGIVERIKAFYIVDCAAKKPKEVLGIIKKVKAKDAWIQRKMLDAILAMPEDIAVQSMPVVLEYLGGQERKDWYFVGEPAANLMIKLSRSHTEEAYKIAWLLVDAWETGEERTLRDMAAKFEEYQYEELIFKYYNKLFEVDAERATGILLKILSRYICEASKKQNYDVSTILHIGMENLEQIDRTYAGVIAILIKGICEGGKAVIEKQPEKVKELMDYLEGLQKAIFYRIEMYLLRFVLKGVETERIRKIISNKEYFEKSGYKYEYKFLLRDKFDEVDDETKKAFLAWVEQQKITEERRKEVEEWCRKNNDKLPDFEKWENQRKGEELYLVRERFKELYENYQRKSGVSDADLAPRPMVGDVRHVSPMEGTPLSPEEMAKKKVDEVLNYILEPKNHERKKKADEWRDPMDALQATFKEDVKKRPIEYLKEGRENLANLPAEFLSSFFYGVSEAIRDGSLVKEVWGDLIELAHKVVQAKQKEEAYRNCFSAILSTLREGFSERENKIEFDEERVRKFWEIIEALIHFPVGDMSIYGEERDPMQLLFNHIAGQALELTVLIGAVCKNDFKNLFKKYLKGERRKCYEYVLSEIRQPGINCVFGRDFARIYWLDSEWVEQNLDRILSDELWDEVWGTYVSWGRPSPDGFKLLVEKGKYGQAVEKLGQDNKFKFQKEPDKGLVEHLMIGYFNGWIGFDDDVFKKFFEKASAGLRGKAARFMTTGFKSVNEEGGEEKEKVAKRMKEYWEKRLAAIKDKKEEKKDEAIELTGWVEDSLLPAKETLELLGQSLDLSYGKIGKMRGARDFVDGVSKLGKGNELLVLRCLKKAAADENMHMPWADIQDPLVKFLEEMVESPENNIRSEAKEVADLYGRYNPEKFRGVWEKLRG